MDFGPRESTVRGRQLNHQLTDMCARLAGIGGRIDRKVPDGHTSG